MRYWYGDTNADYSQDTATVSGVNLVGVFAPGLLARFYNARTGGTEYTDLVDGADAPVGSVVTSDGGDGRGPGMIPGLRGPDDVPEMWVSVDGGPRVLLVGRLAPAVQANQQAIATTAADLATHKAARNAHGTLLADLADVTVPAQASRTPGDVLGVLADKSMGLLTPAQAAGALLLNPPKVGGNYVGNVAQPPDPTQGSGGNPWLRLQAAYSAADDNPDMWQYGATTPGGLWVKTNWGNGNGEGRRAPSTANRIADRVFEYAEGLGGPSTGRFVEWSTNPTNAANREALLAGYGTGHSTKPGWVEATRVLSGLLGVRAGGSYNGLSAVNFRGRSGTAGAPTSGTWVVGDLIIDSAGAPWLCTVAGTPGTWVGGGGGGSNEAGPSAYVDITPGTNMGHATRHAATRLERGGDSVRLRGALTASGAVASGAVIATIPTAGHRPLSGVTTIARYTGGGNKFDVATNGDITYQAAFTAGQTIWLDSITWDLSA